MCAVFYADYFLLVPKLLFRGKTILCLNINVLLVLVIGLSMRLWQWFIFPGDPMPGPPPGPGMMPVKGLRPDMEISFFIRDVTLLALVAGLAVDTSTVHVSMTISLVLTSVHLFPISV